MNGKTVEIQRVQSVAVVWLNRPEVRNAMNDVMVEELCDAFGALDADREVRAVAIAGRGAAFCAGADLRHVKRMGVAARGANERDAERLTAMFHRLYTMKKPTLARVHGAAYAGALGLVAACDIAVAAQDAEFCVSEVKVGLAAVTILPYVLQAVGARPLRRYVLSAEVFTAAEAYRIGLVQELAAPEELDATVNGILGHLVNGAPEAQAAAKELIDAFGARPLTQEIVSATAKRFAALRACEEAREGVDAMLAKRPPAWLASSSPPPQNKRKR